MSAGPRGPGPEGMAIFTIGTAGHIDHGKTTLCKVITGVDTDRLAEEKKRGISIELGFASFATPAGRRVGIVDVPGHERFIRNMVAGVSGIQSVLFTIAADEGIMPQTREHFDILHLLGVHRGVIALTKCDLCEDEWIDMMDEEIRAYLAGSPFEPAEIVRVSARRPETFPALLQALDRILEQQQGLDTRGLFRMPIDRVFSLKGHGTVITGTVAGGSLRTGEQVEILPQVLTSRVRHLQSFYETDEEVFAGQRAAINVPEIEPSAIRRGSTVARPGSFTPTSRVDCRLKLLRTLPGSFSRLKHASRVRFYVGTTEVMARVFMMEGLEMEAGQEALVQFHLEEPVVASRSDRYLIRTFSPMFTIGGGIVLDATPSRHRRDARVVERLTRLEQSDSIDLVRQTLRSAEGVFLTRDDIVRAVGLNAGAVDDLIARLSPEVGKLHRKRELYYSVDQLAVHGDRLREVVLQFHAENPLKLGVERAVLLARFNPRMDADAFNELLGLVAGSHQIEIEASLIRKAGFRPQLDEVTEGRLESIRRILEDQGFCSPNQLESATGLKRQDHDKLLGLLMAQGEVVRIPDGQLSLKRTIDRLQGLLVDLLTRKGTAGVGDIKDQLGMTRKSLIPLLEYFDEKEVTIRIGNERRLKQSTKR